jgi:hypothetical protein
MMCVLHLCSRQVDPVAQPLPESAFREAENGSPPPGLAAEKEAAPASETAASEAAKAPTRAEAPKDRALAVQKDAAADTGDRVHRAAERAAASASAAEEGNAAAGVKSPWPHGGAAAATAAAPAVAQISQLASPRDGGLTTPRGTPSASSARDFSAEGQFPA